jgi:hypothetical protein
MIPRLKLDDCPFQGVFEANVKENLSRGEAPGVVDKVDIKLELPSSP